MGLREFASRLAGHQVEERAEPPQLFNLLTGEWSGYAPASYTAVSYDTAQAHSAVYACVDLLVRLIVWQMPVQVIGTDGPARPVARVSQLITNPHPEPHMLAEHWRAMALESAVMRGFAAGVVTSREPSGWPRQIMPVHPDSVTWYSDPSTGQTVDWRVDGTKVDLWQTGGELWLAPSLRVTPGAPVGKSVLAHAAQQVRLGLDARKFGQDWFQAGGLPVAHGKLIDNPNITQEQASALKRRILETTRNREPLITGNNFELTTIPINAEESQFLQTMQANVADVCRFFGIPPEMVGGSSGDSMTYANVEGRNLGLLTNTVGAWMNWFERVLASMLPRPQLVELDPKALLRTSTSVNFDNAAKGIGISQPGFVTIDEARVLVGLPSIGGEEGSRLYVPTHYAPSNLIEDIVLPEPEVVVSDGEQAPAA